MQVYCQMLSSCLVCLGYSKPFGLGTQGFRLGMTWEESAVCSSCFAAFKAALKMVFELWVIRPSEHQTIIKLQPRPLALIYGCAQRRWTRPPGTMGRECGAWFGSGSPERAYQGDGGRPPKAQVRNLAILRADLIDGPRSANHIW